MNKGKTRFNLNKYAQTLPAEQLYDFDDRLEDNFQTIDFDEYEKRQLPVFTEEEATNYIADQFEEEISRDLEQRQVEEMQPDVPIEVTEEELPEFENAEQAVNYAIENNKVLRINYVTQGKESRGGRKLKREVGLPPGADITRIIEPHHIFTAGTGNTLAVTYDRSIRGIRAYIVDNIINYTFTGKDFRPRMRIVPSEKKVKPMNNEIFEQLEQVGNILETQGFQKSASVVTDSMKTLLQVKTAQYVGLQGYYIRNNRCWQNCYRQKRTTEANAQKVWFDCLTEYQESINNDGTAWDKYASEEDKKFVKIASVDQKKAFQKENKVVLSHIHSKVKKGMGTGEAIFITLEERKHNNLDRMSDVAQNLTFLADDLKEAGQEELSKKLALVTTDIVKEAQFGEGKNPFQRAGDWLKKKWTGQGTKPDIIRKLQDVVRRANKLLADLNKIPTTATSKSFIIEAGKGTRIVESQIPSAYDLAQQPGRAEQLRRKRSPGAPAPQSAKDRELDIRRNQIREQLEERRQQNRARRAVKPTVEDTTTPAMPLEQNVAAPDYGAPESVTTDSVGDVIPPTTEPSVPEPIAPTQEPVVETPPAPAMPSTYANLNQDYRSFISDANQLTTELLGFGGKDAEVNGLVQSALPLLQNFVNSSNELGRQQRGSAQREFLRGSLQELISGVQGILPGGQVPQSQSTNVNLQEEGPTEPVPAAGESQGDASLAAPGNMGLEGVVGFINQRAEAGDATTLTQINNYINEILRPSQDSAA